MPLISILFLDAKWDQHPYSTLTTLAKNLKEAVANIEKLGVTQGQVSCLILSATPMPPEDRVIAKVSCLLDKHGRSDSIINQVAITVAEAIKKLFPRFVVEVVVEPLVPETHTFTV